MATAGDLLLLLVGCLTVMCWCDNDDWWWWWWIDDGDGVMLMLAGTFLQR